MRRDEFVKEYMSGLNATHNNLESFKNILIEIYNTHVDKKRGLRVRTKNSKVILIIETVANHYRLSYSELIQRTRKREIVEARQVAAHLLKSNTNLSLQAIGKLLGDRNHATIVHSIKEVNNLLETNKEFRIKFQQIKIASINN